MGLLPMFTAEFRICTMSAAPHRPTRLRPVSQHGRTLPTVLLWIVLLAVVLTGCWLAYQPGGQHLSAPVSPPAATSPGHGTARTVHAPATQAAPEPPVPARTARPDVATGVALADLPDPARHLYRLIAQGGPFAYDKDGTVFFNRERLLPVRPRGYYREYTVAHPSARSRGARRIVCGGAPRQPDACWYTADHYQSFTPILSLPQQAPSS